MSSPDPPRRADLSGVAGWIAGHARAIAVTALVVALLSVLVGATALSKMSSDIGDPNAPSALALARVQAASGAGPRPDDIVVIVDLAAPWPAAADRARVDAVAARLRAVPGVVVVVAPVDGANPELIATDRRSALVTAGISAQASSDDVARAVRSAWRSDPSVAIGGSAAIGLDVNDRVGADLQRAEILAFPILFLLAIWIFRGLVAAAVPLIVGGLAIVMTLAAMRGVLEFITLSQYVVNLVIGLGLGLAIDYCLFMISRYREEVLVDGYGPAAVIRTVVHAGRTVLFSTVTVALALATLLLFPQRFLYSMGIGGVLVTGSAAVAAVVVLPALLILLGPRIDMITLSRWSTARHRESGEITRSRWYQLSRYVTAHATLFLAGALLLAALLATPAAFTKFGDVDETSLPTSSTARIVSERAGSDFPGGGGSDVFLAVDAAESKAVAVDALATQVAGAAQTVLRSGPATRYVGRSTWVIDLTVSGSPYAAPAQRAVSRIRALPRTVPFYIGGDAASFADLESSVGAHLPLALVIVALAVIFVIFRLTGSVVLSLKTFVLNLLNVAMTFGVLVFVFQFGHLEWLLRFHSNGRIDLTQPILVATIAFGLSTDYGVFLFARIKEAHDEGHGDVEAVAMGIGRSGRIISSAALLLCVAIGAFATSSILFIKELGVGAAVAVFLDATLVRAVLVPSAMALLGAANWWAPTWRPSPPMATPPSPDVVESVDVAPADVVESADVAPADVVESVRELSELLAQVTEGAIGELWPAAANSAARAAQFAALQAISRDPSLNLTRLSVVLSTGPSATRAVVDHLLSLGLAERSANPADRRERLVLPTDTAVRLLYAIEARRRAELNRRAARLSPSGRSALVSSLRELLAGDDASGWSPPADEQPAEPVIVR